MFLARAIVQAGLVITLASACTGAPKGQSGAFTALDLPPLQSAQSATQGATRIGVGDKLDITVFQVEDLTVEDALVDAAGVVEFPLVGSVTAAGLTPSELARLLEQRLGQAYLRNPSVTVRVSEAASQKITVDGAVEEAGVFEMKGATTLMQAVAMAKGATSVANSRSVAVFRNQDGQRMVALFDLAEIRSGRAADPILHGDDIVFVDTSRLNAALRDIISVLPAIAAFQVY